MHCSFWDCRMQNRKYKVKYTVYLKALEDSYIKVKYISDKLVKIDIAQKLKMCYNFVTIRKGEKIAPKTSEI